MGTITLNVNARVEAPYQTRINSLNKGANCMGFIFENTLSLATESPIVDNLILLAPWMMSTAGLTLKSLHIKDLVYTDSDSLWYEYNGVKLLPSTSYEIDITGLGYEDIVPLLKVKGQQIPNDTTTQTVNCRIALEDTDDIKYEYRQNTTIVYYTSC